MRIPNVLSPFSHVFITNLFCFSNVSVDLLFLKANSECERKKLLVFHEKLLLVIVLSF